jgi:hypothetical protein
MTIRVQHVDPNYIYQVWPLVKPWIVPVFEKSLLSNYYSIDNLKEYIIRGEQVMLVGVDEDGGLQGEVTIQWCNYPNSRVAYITTFGANIGAELEVYNEFVKWLKAMGATRVECSARPSVARLLKNKMGFTPSNQISLELVL